MAETVPGASDAKISGVRTVVKAEATCASEIEAALSLERFGRYLDWAGGEREAALVLYAANTRLSEALYTPLQMLEVVLRNRIHRVMAVSYGEWWFRSSHLVVLSNQSRQVRQAVEDVIRARKPLQPGKIVAALTFSFWTAMLGATYENLWQTKLNRIAIRENGKGLRRKDLSTPLRPIRTLRNRIAHHEPILHWDLPVHYEMILTLTSWLSPAAAAWTRQNSRFPAVFGAETMLPVPTSRVEAT